MDSEPSSAQLKLSQHSEPELEQQILSATACSQTNASVSRSCYACNGKKIRCDKQRPCSSCTRSDRLCSYPRSGPRIRRSKQTLMAEMASRISSLEKSLAKAKDEQRTGPSVPKTPISETTNTTSSAQPARETYSGNLSEKSREDVVVQNGSSTQYFNEILLSRVIEEVSYTNVDGTSIITYGADR